MPTFKPAVDSVEAFRVDDVNAFGQGAYPLWYEELAARGDVRHEYAHHVIAVPGTGTEEIVREGDYVVRGPYGTAHALPGLAFRFLFGPAEGGDRADAPR